jgi:ADP-ribose pyrophosphatase YjhB (NUDIX family)
LPDFESSYIGQLRERAPDMPLILPAVRAILKDADGRILLVQRADNRSWSLPAGGVEQGESVMDCLRREVLEETGLEVLQATAICFYSEPRFTYTNSQGFTYQRFSLAFRVDLWEGHLLQQTDETVSARFFLPESLPEIPAHHKETLDDLDRFTGTLIVK